MAARQLPLWLTWERLRDATLFFSGIGIAFYETVAENIDRPSLLILAAGMMGLPAFLPRRDSK